MIRYLKREEINIDKYNSCINEAVNSQIYAFSWYLDIVADNWDALVLNDYEAVMPIPWRRKYFIKYTYQPLWVLQLGVFSTNKNLDVDSFIQVLINKFRYINLRLNTGNSLNKYFKNSVLKQMQYLSLQNTYQTIFSNYNRNRKREITKAHNYKLVANWNDNPIKLIELFKNNVGKRTPNIIATDYNILLKLLNKVTEKGMGDLLSIYTDKNDLVAIAYFLKHKNKVTELVCSTDFENRDNGANTFMNDSAIFKYKEEFEVFNFGGSSIKNISNYYKSFGAKTENYSYLNFNNLPFLLRLFKH